MAADTGKPGEQVATIRPDSRSHPIGRTSRGYTVWCLWGQGCPICSRRPGDEDHDR